MGIFPEILTLEPVPESSGPPPEAVGWRSQTRIAGTLTLTGNGSVRTLRRRAAPSATKGWCAMVARARRKLLGRMRKGVFHCTARCVRRAFLCGHDPVSGQDYSYRRDWILQREEQLAGLFAIDVEFHAELINHLHLVLRTRPEVARRWSDEEVARRWLTATKLAKSHGDELPQPDSKKLKKLLKNKQEIESLRRRLTSVSWFMGFLNENIARRANREDGTTGHFWEARFRCRECTDKNAILLCGVYVDLNQIKAGEAQSVHTSRYTSVYQRLQAQAQRADAPDRADGWLGELTFRAGSDQDEQVIYRSRTGRRASDLGLLPLTLDEYVWLLEATVALWKAGEPKVVPHDLEALLQRLEIQAEGWCETLDKYERVFCHALGSPATLAEVAQRMEARCLKGTAACRRVFA
jgi:hypothetical protein